LSHHLRWGQRCCSASVQWVTLPNEMCRFPSVRQESVMQVLFGCFQGWLSVAPASY
jgi:hypothetical protein